ncbi:MAG: 2-C-methyl-D-erythritol 2,4-cyclodiphosphate synthase [Bacteroidales bacterium]|nr:2-C-methyl-D-erythritol 2,4-cyclodiphosphate synthase [Deltaproteobacteria bacterium]MBL7139056.1 2-C-methyl-D-erythritol 2,4-cyclodiphosphate synthase [Bacteroidales bacterium]
MNFRIGFGFDTHRLEEWKEFWLGGVLVPHTKGAVGHSDADVLIHAICDALLGAASLRDIGTRFPDTSDEFKGIDSKILLKKTCALIRENGYSIGNIDATVVLQAPKIGKYIPEMLFTLSDVMGISQGDLSIKAKTSETLGFIGREEGISAYAVALILLSEI